MRAVVSTPFFTASSVGRAVPHQKRALHAQKRGAAVRIGAHLRHELLQASFYGQSASFVSGVDIMMLLSVLNRVFDVPSMVFRHTLP